MIGHEAPTARSQWRNVGRVERWASLLGGTLLAVSGVRRPGLSGMVFLAAGGGLIYRGATGHCPLYGQLGVGTTSHLADGQPNPMLETPRAAHLVTAMTIRKSPEELYAFWRNFENLPTFMHHLKSVTVLGERLSHWVAKAPFGASVGWDAEIIADEPNRRIAWRSTADADVVNAGDVRFVPAPAGRGTEVRVHIDYVPPGGKLAVAVARLFGEAPDQRVREDLRRFKQMMEAGEVPTTAGQPTCR
ncbi:MAG: DUF2892 domain-containing protein [Candidatus Sericytochromatia bacterium]|nr:DUF2892 domain-containing protein [Candidatus Sericytochromatia bacterium]